MQRFFDFFKHNLVMILSILFFIWLTFPQMIFHFPYFDEAHAWMLAKFMNSNNWIEIIKAEGHPIVWFALLMPFAKTNFFYPYSMLIINWLAWFSAICIMWFCAPFNKWFKAVITFSSISIVYLSVAARGYSLGFLGLFILATLYNKQLKHPIIYSIIIGLTAHINIFCAIEASAFGLILIYKLVKENIRNKAVPISILITFAFLLIFPFLSGYGDDASRHFAPPSIWYLLKFFSSYNYLFLILYASIVICIFKKCELLPKLFWGYTFLLQISVFAFFYHGFAHHFILLFVYLIFPIWISQKTDMWSKFDLTYIFFTILLLLPLKPIIAYYYYDDYCNVKEIVNFIQKEIPNKTLFIGTNYYSIIPFLIDKNPNLYDACYQKKISYKTNFYCSPHTITYDDFFPNQEEFSYLVAANTLPHDGENIERIAHNEKVAVYKLARDAK